MNDRSWQFVLCGLIFLASLDSALAQKADFAGAARAATQGGELDQAYPKLSPGLLENMKNEILNLLPQSDRPRFLSDTPRGSDLKVRFDYYTIVRNCIDQGWRRNCG